MIASSIKRFSTSLMIIIVPFFNLLAQCDALFSYSIDDLTVTFTDNSTTTPDDPIVEWSWNFGDGNSSSVQNPVHTYLEQEDFIVTLTILTQNGCISTVTITIELDPCLLDVILSTGNCDAEGNIEIDIVINDPFDNAREVTVLLDNQAIPGSPFEIDLENPVILTTSLPGDGLEHSLVVTSTDILTCQSVTNFTLPDCSSNCFLSGLTINMVNGADHNIIVGPGGGNSFAPQQLTMTLGDVVNFIWEDDGHTTTSDAVSGPDSWNSGLLGIGAQYAVNIQQPGLHPYYCIPHGGPGGVGMSGVIIANCPQSNSFDLNISFQTTQAGTGGYQIKVDGIQVPGSPFPYSGTGNENLIINLPGDGLPHDIEVIDVGDQTCMLTSVWNAPDCGAAPQCTLEIVASEVTTCDAQNMVGIQLDVTSVNGSASGFNVFLDGTPVSGNPYTYQAGGLTQITIPVAGDGLNHLVGVEDIEDLNCVAEVSFVTTDCSLGCGITNLLATSGSATTHIVYVEDFQFNPASITIAAGDIVEWQWTGDIEHTATSDVTQGADSWDSGLLGNGGVFQSPVLSAGIHPYYCIPHGGPGGEGMSGAITVLPDCTDGMVPVNVSFEQMITGTNGFNVLVDGINTGTYAYGQGGTTSLVVFVNGDGQSHSLEIQDVDSPDCNAFTNISVPDCNAQTCQLSLTAAASTVCQDGLVSVEITVEDNGGGSGSGFEIQMDGIPLDTFFYSGTGMTTVSFQVSGDGQEHIFSVLDLDDSQCSDAVPLTLIDCNEPCNLTDLTLEIAGVGGPQKHSIEVADFEFIPNELNVYVGDTILWNWSGIIAHTATSDAEGGPDSWDSGLLTEGATFEVVITTEGFHPYYCIPHGGPGGQGMSGSINALPQPPPCDSAGNVTLDISFMTSGVGEEGYFVLVDSTSIGNFTYSVENPNMLSILLQGDGQQHGINIVDISDPACNIYANIEIPFCDTMGVCMVDLAAEIVGECDENNNIDVLLTVNGNDTGNGFQVFVDGEIFVQDTFFYSTATMISLPGTGESHLIEIVDIDFPECTASTSIDLPLCTSECSMDLSYEQVSGCDDEGNVGYNIIMTISNQGDSGFNIYLDGNLQPGSPYAYGGTINSIEVLLPGDGALHELVFEDIDQVSCSDTLIIETNNCDEPCELSNLEIFYQVPRVHEIEVRDFDFFPKDIQVEVGDTVRWIWTGVIAHTSTSDATSGDGVWNSGLLNNGAVFEVVITTEGFHPYYCIPHGAPGGQGMSGAITAVDPCEDGEVNMLFRFIGQNTGINGYEAFLDGNELSGSPYSYMEPTNEIILNVPGDGLTHTISINDLDEPGCFLDSLFLMPDCSDPCWAFAASFDFEVDLLTKQVSCISTVENGINWFWDFGDGSTALTEEASHFYEQAGSYEICLTVENEAGCMDTFCEIIQFEDIFCVAGMTYEQLGFEIFLEDSSMVSAPVTGWNWSLNGDPISQDSVAYFEYDTPGMYSVCLEIETDQCSDEQCWEIDLSDPCLPLEAGFDYEITPSDLSVQFFDQSSGSPDSWLWGFGTGDISYDQHPVYYFEEAGNYTICLLVQDTQNGCLSTFCDTINYLITDLKRPSENNRLKVYPNPVEKNNSSIIFLEGIDEIDYGKELLLEVVNISGSRIFESVVRGAEICSININQRLTPGMYFIVVATENKIYRAKILAQ